MQNIVTPILAPTPAPPVESKPSPRTPASNGFAHLLRQSQAATAGPATAAPVKPPPPSARDAQEAQADEAARPTASAAASAQDARRVDESRSSERRVERQRDDRRAEGEDDATTHDDAKRPADAADATGSGTPSAHGLVALHRPVAATAESASPDRKIGAAARADATGRGDAVEPDNAAGSLTTSPGPLAARKGAIGERQDDRPALARLGADAIDPVEHTTEEASAAIAKTAPFAAGALRTESAAPAALAIAPAAVAATNAAAVDATIATPVASPDFAQAIAVQVSVLVKDGVQRAELHLNPVEMGPVSVQIVVDGSQARIDFGADAAATRQAIEAGLPELASALRDAGMTLQGGGVSQHARDPNAEPGAGGRAGATRAIAADDDAARAAPVARRHTVAAGGVDLYA